ncbi:hypothetical protein QL285_070376 [Trifolium repens]|nr:hypothetical protein QL285_070376 [Trifolium repens]
MNLKTKISLIIRTRGSTIFIFFNKEVYRLNVQSEEEFNFIDLCVLTRAVKTGGPACFGPTLSGFGFCRAGLKSSDENRAAKIVLKPGPVRALGLLGRFFF